MKVNNDFNSVSFECRCLFNVVNIFASIQTMLSEIRPIKHQIS